MLRSKCERQDDMGVLSGVLKSQLCNLIDETGEHLRGWLALNAVHDQLGRRHRTFGTHGESDAGRPAIDKL